MERFAFLLPGVVLGFAAGMHIPAIAAGIAGLVVGVTISGVAARVLCRRYYDRGYAAATREAASHLGGVVSRWRTEQRP